MDNKNICIVISTLNHETITAVLNINKKQASLINKEIFFCIALGFDTINEKYKDSVSDSGFFLHFSDFKKREHLYYQISGCHIPQGFL